MLEKQYQTLFNRWCQHEFFGTAVFELKRSFQGRLAFDVVKEHQVNALYQAKHNKIIFKIPDAGFQNPFDSFQMERVMAYVVVFDDDDRKKMPSKKGSTTFYMIDIDAFIKEKEESKYKSMTIERMGQIGMRKTLKKITR